MPFIVASLIALLKKVPSEIIYFTEIMLVFIITEVFGKRCILLKNEEVNIPDFF